MPGIYCLNGAQHVKYNVLYTVIGRRVRAHLSADVGALTPLGDEVFIVFLNNYQRIHVYGVANMQHTRNIPVPELGYFCWGLAACQRYSCVYASDWGNDCIHRVHRSGSHAVKWSVASRPAGLSLTSDHSLLVACQGEYKLQEFTTHGLLLRNISILEHTPESQVMQAIQLPDDLFLFTHFGKPHAVSAISGSSGHGASFSGPHCSDLQQLNRPAGLAVDKDGRVLVADWYNNRLLVLCAKMGFSNPEISYIHTMSVSVDGGLKGPCSLWYDQTRKRLYIGQCEWGGAGVIVVDHLEDFSAEEM